LRSPHKREKANSKKTKKGTKMRKAEISTKKEAVKYLNNVLLNWKEFCRTHAKIAKSIKIILSENERKENERNLH
jgi:hypothetical protein